MRAIEFLTEIRNRMYQYIKSVLPNWPDYVLKDWVYGLARGDHQAGVYFKPDDDFDKWGFNKETILKMVKDSGLSPDTKWQLVPNMKFTMDMFNPKTKQNLIGRAGGSSDLGMGIPRDKERHATQAALAQQQGGVSKEPVLLIKTATGYDLPEGWHRTIQHFHKYPDGYTGPAYVAVAQGQQGVAEGTDQSLSSMVNQDQSERNEYKNFVKSQAGGDWSKGAKMYAQLKKRPSNDIFGDASRLNQFMKMKFDFDKFTNEDWDNYWLLAQHCDDNRDFQKNALSIIKEYQGTDNSHYKYLYDRISMGLTGKQKYGTQNVKEQGVTEGNFDSFKFGKPITFTAYHSSDSKIKRILPTDEFYFSDDRYTWEGNYLYKIKITLKNPYVVLDQKAGYEGHASDSLPKIKAAGYDGVIYTPYSVDYGFRQGVCFYPQRQISNIKLVNSDSGE
jgi:hypothetical protein